MKSINTFKGQIVVRIEKSNASKIGTMYKICNSYGGTHNFIEVGGGWQIHTEYLRPATGEEVRAYKLGCKNVNKMYYYLKGEGYEIY